MAIDGEELEGGLKLAQVRRTKKWLIAAQIVISVVAVVVLVSVGGGLQLKPFYFDVGVFLYFLLLMLFIIAMEDLIFRLLEVRYAKTASAKYYMLKTTARRSMAVIAICAVALLLVLTPFLLDTVTEVSSETGTTSNGVAPFFSRDALGLTTVDRITVESEGPTGVLIVSEGNYLAHSGNWDLMRQYSEASVPDASAGVTVPFAAVPFGQYYIIAEDEASYSIHRSMSSFFVGFITLFATLFIGSHVAWLIYTTPLRQRFVKGAIYR